MRFIYSEWDGTQQPPKLPAEEAFDKLSDFVMEYGERVLRHLGDLDPEQQALWDRMLKEGLLERDRQGRYRIAPRGLHRMEDKALSEFFTKLHKGSAGKHQSGMRGAGEVVHEDTRPYEYGDPVSQLNLGETLGNAVRRQGPGTPIRIEEEDFVVYDTEYQTSCATVVLLDMSGSMTRFGKFFQAKKVAMALRGMVRSQYAGDFLQFIGFYSYASPIPENRLATIAPKPVSMYDPRVYLRVDLDEPPERVPQHFTNIQVGLHHARRMLARQPVRNRQIICITDGEPTAHVEGRELFLIYPPSERSATATLQEVLRCTQAGIRINTFALVEDYFYLGLVNFVDEMSRLARGMAVYCTADQLGRYVLDSFVAGRRQRRHIG